MVAKSCHEFFKVYLSQLSSKQLGLPPAFVSKLGGKIPTNCTIKDSDEKIWQVKSEGAEGGLVVANGWEEFACHHSLVDGDFLVFDYDGDSQFGVKIYGINGLRKRKASDAVASTSAVKKGRQQRVEECSNSLPLRPRPQGLRPNRVYKRRNSEMPGCHEHSVLKLKQCRPHAMPFKVEEAASDFTSAYPYFKAVMGCRSDVHVPCKFVIDHIKPRTEHTQIMLLVANGKWSVTLNTYFKYGSFGKLSAGWRRFVCDNCLEMGDECVFELINNDPVIMKVSIFKHNGYEHANRKPNTSRPDVVPSKAEEGTTNIITSNYPHFKAVVCPRHFVGNMHVPSKFVMDHIKPKMEYPKQRVKKVIESQLLVMDNKWIVGMNVYFKHGGCGKLSSGWVKFVRDNYLEVGDECLFELINNDPVIMKVSIFKHNSLS